MENQQSLWQRHLLLIVGVALPFLLIVFVTVYQRVVSATVADPLYAAVYLTSEGSEWADGRFDAQIVNGHLQVVFTPPKDAQKRTTPKTESTVALMQVYVVRDVSKIPEMYEFRSSPEMTTEKKMDLPDGLSFRMTAGPDAPDGYRMVYPGYRDRGFINGMLVGSSSQQRGPFLEKNGRVIEIKGPKSPDFYYHYPRFMGWSADEVKK